MFHTIYKNLYFLGLKSGYLIRDFFLFLFKKIKVPFQMLSALCFAGYLLFDRKVLSKFRRFGREWKALLADYKQVRENLRESYKESYRAGWNRLKFYVQKAMHRHKAVFSKTVSVVLPILMLVILCSTVSHYANRRMGLEVKYNDAVIGYVESENVFQEAQRMAQDRLSSVARVEQLADTTKNEAVSFAVKPVKRSELKDSNVLCEEILKRSNNKTTNACGVYINDNFLCAVKNETDATTVFDKILRNYQTDDPNDVVGFVEDVGYVQGLYPDSKEVMWDAARLSDTLNSKKEAAEYYTTVSGDSLSGIASKFGLKIAELQALNPGLTENIHIGDKILVSREVNYIQVKVTKTEQRNVVVPYKTEKEESSKIYSGQKRTKRKGKNGEERVTELVTYVDGVRVSAKEISRETIHDPVTEIIQVGTKKGSSYGGGPVGPYNTTSYGGRFIWPAVGAYSVSSPFGGRRHHGGIDIVKPGGRSAGCLVVAAGSGTVVRAGRHSSYGNYVVIDHGGDLRTLYAHMQNGSIKVRAGQHVSAGQAIGNIGATGNAYGAHLHFEVRVNHGRTRVNPMPYLK